MIVTMITTTIFMCGSICTGCIILNLNLNLTVNRCRRSSLCIDQTLKNLSWLFGLVNVLNRLIFHKHNISAPYELPLNGIIKSVPELIMTITDEHTLPRLHLKLRSINLGNMNKCLTPKDPQVTVRNILTSPNPLWNITIQWSTW